MKKLGSYLALSPSQAKKVRPIIQDQINKKRDLLEKKGKGDREGLRTELQMIQQNTERLLANILTPEQLKRYRKFQEEQQEEIKSQRNKGGGKGNRGGGGRRGGGRFGNF